MSIETDVQAIVSNLQTRATAVIGTASALEQQVNNQPPIDTTTVVIDANNSVTISVGSNSITINSSGISFSGAINLPSGSTINGEAIASTNNVNDAISSHVSTYHAPE